MKVFTSLMLALIAANCCNAQIRPSPHAWSATLKVVDEASRPVPAAAVWVAFCIGAPDGTPLDQRITGVTDTNGIFTARHTDPSVQLAFHAEKPGYYGISVQHYLGFSVEKRDVDWNPSPTLILTTIRNPIPMYAGPVSYFMPTNDKPVGFDFVLGDWVAPYGKGRTTDILFITKFDKRAEDDYDYALTVGFTNPADGIQGFASPGGGLRSPHEAPKSGYQAQIVTSQSRRPGPPSEYLWNDRTNYFVRVRTLLDEKGNVKSALYGKIYGDFNHFYYYLNPTANDHNVEFDPARNLLPNLKGVERVLAP